MVSELGRGVLNSVSATLVTAPQGFSGLQSDTRDVDAKELLLISHRLA